MRMIVASTCANSSSLDAVGVVAARHLDRDLVHGMRLDAGLAQLAEQSVAVRDRGPLRREPSRSWTQIIALLDGVTKLRR